MVQVSPSGGIRTEFYHLKAMLISHHRMTSHELATKRTNLCGKPATKKCLQSLGNVHLKKMVVATKCSKIIYYKKLATCHLLCFMLLSCYTIEYSYVICFMSYSSEE